MCKGSNPDRFRDEYPELQNCPFRKWSVFMDDSLQDGVRERFGVLPNFFRLTSSDSTITRNLWDSRSSLIRARSPLCSPAPVAASKGGELQCNGSRSFSRAPQDIFRLVSQIPFSRTDGRWWGECGWDRILLRVGTAGIPAGKTHLERPAKTAGRSSRFEAQGLRSEASPKKWVDFVVGHAG